MAHHAGIPSTNYIQLEESRTEDDDLQILRYLDERAGGRGFTPWRPFEHPQLGPVEIGGWEFKFGLMNPPGPLLPATIGPAVLFAIAAMGTAPRLRIATAATETIAPGLYRVWADFANDGFLSTSGSEMNKGRGKGKPLRATLGLPDGARALPTSGGLVQELPHLAGRVSQHTSLHLAARYPNLSRGHVEWLIAAPRGSEFTITIDAERAGRCSTTVIAGE